MNGGHEFRTRQAEAVTPSGFPELLSALRQYIWLLYTTSSFRHTVHSHEITNLWYAIMTIFYQGSLQEGIALAVREAKAVVCFVRGRYLPAW